MERRLFLIGQLPEFHIEFAGVGGELAPSFEVEYAVGERKGAGDFEGLESIVQELNGEARNRLFPEVAPGEVGLFQEHRDGDELSVVPGGVIGKYLFLLDRKRIADIPEKIVGEPVFQRFPVRRSPFGREGEGGGGLQQFTEEV